MLPAPQFSMESSMKESNMPKADFLMSIALILFGVFVIIISSQMPDFREQNFNKYSNPGLVPAVLGVIFIILGLVMLIRSIIRKGYRIEIGSEHISAWIQDKSTRRFLTTLSLSVIYALVLLGRVHFFIATAIYMFAFILMFEYRLEKKLLQQKKTVLIALFMALTTAGVVFGVFRYLFLVNLPG
jgi:putative tricarboxylic transport membrane protein